MYPSKWIAITKFLNNETKDSFFHTNIITFFKKPNKIPQWYLKVYRGLSDSYETEAVAGDLYRFILGKDRAAKSQVAYGEKGKMGVISQENSAGYESALDIHIRTHKHYDDIVSVENGRCEVAIAEFILEETDGLQGPCNVGLNKKKEVTRIDFDCSFSKNKEKPNNIFIYDINEKLVLKTNDLTVINRFYKTMLKIVLLTDPTILSVICDRHMYPQLKTYVRHQTLTHSKIISQDLLRSEPFMDFMKSYDSAEIINDCRDFFKHEAKKFPSKFNDCMASINAHLTQIKALCQAERNAHIRSLHAK